MRWLFIAQEGRGRGRVSRPLGLGRESRRSIEIAAAEIAGAGPFRPMEHILEACRASLGNA